MIIRMSYIIAIIAFVISFLFFGNGCAQAIQTGASWGFWTVLVLGGLICLFATVTSLMATIAAGGVIGYKIAGIPGSIAGVLGATGMTTLIILAPIISFSLALAGYDAIGDWTATNLEDDSLALRGVVLLGLGFLMSAIRSRR